MSNNRIAHRGSPVKALHLNDVRQLVADGLAELDTSPSNGTGRWSTAYVDGLPYTTRNGSTWWALDECQCNGANRDSCPVCRAAASVDVSEVF